MLMVTQQWCGHTGICIIIMCFYVAAFARFVLRGGRKEEQLPAACPLLMNSNVNYTGLLKIILTFLKCHLLRLLHPDSYIPVVALADNIILFAQDKGATRIVIRILVFYIQWHRSTATTSCSTVISYYFIHTTA